VPQVDRHQPGADHEHDGTCGVGVHQLGERGSQQTQEARLREREQHERQGRRVEVGQHVGAVRPDADGPGERQRNQGGVAGCRDQDQLPPRPSGEPAVGVPVPELLHEHPDEEHVEVADLLDPERVAGGIDRDHAGQ
jgi:hypothetical protein